MSEPTCPFAKPNTESSLPKTMQEYMKRYLILRPRLDSRYFEFDYKNPINYGDSLDPLSPLFSRDSELSITGQKTFLSPMGENPVESGEEQTQSPDSSFQLRIIEETPSIELDTSCIVDQLVDNGLIGSMDTNNHVSSPEDKNGLSNSSSASSFGSSNSEELSIETTSQAVDRIAHLNENRRSGLIIKSRLRNKDRLITKETIQKSMQIFKNLNKHREDHTYEFRPKRMKASEKVNDEISPLIQKPEHGDGTSSDGEGDTLSQADTSLESPNLLQGSEMMRSDLYKIGKPWEKDEVASLMKGYNRYGAKWRLIQRKYNLRRSLAALDGKFIKLKRRGKISSKRTHSKSEKWTEEELSYIEEGVKNFGKRWQIILENYEFKDSRNRGSLRKMYYDMHSKSAK